MTEKQARPSNAQILLTRRYDVRGLSVDMSAPAPVVLLLHPPKTGGTTVHFNLEAVQSSRRLPYTRFRIERDKWTPPTLMVRGWTGAWNAPEINVDGLSHLTAQPLQAPLFISGHFPYGIHERLKAFFPDRPFYYIGQVRDPVDRELSALNYEAAKSANGVGASDYLAMIRDGKLLDNPQTRMFAGYEAMLDARCTRDTLRQAKENIAQAFNLIASTQQTHNLMSALVSLYRLPEVAYHQSNITVDKEVEGFPSHIVGQLERFHYYDMELHDFVKSGWGEWEARHRGENTRQAWADPVVYVPQSYDADRTAYGTFRGAINRAMAGISVERELHAVPLIQKTPDNRLRHP